MKRNRPPSRTSSATFATPAGLSGMRLNWHAGQWVCRCLEITSSGAPALPPRREASPRSRLLVVSLWEVNSFPVHLDKASLGRP
ncbi:MAG: hypothetical protein KJ070_01870 [Verrucomicrobia bacterium]|nr:hypothetical protein [Verrucomicrobiota bacterium]